MAESESDPNETVRREAVLVPVIVLGFLAFVFKAELLTQVSLITLKYSQQRSAIRMAP